MLVDEVVALDELDAWHDRDRLREAEEELEQRRGGLRGGRQAERDKRRAEAFSSLLDIR